MFADRTLTSPSGDVVGSVNLIGPGNDGSYIISGEATVGAGGPYGEVSCWL
jgi:hypothetical protein